MTQYDNNQQAETRSHLNTNEFSLLRRLSITSLVVLFVTSCLLIFLYWQDQIAFDTKLAAAENEKILIYLQHKLGDQINSFVTGRDRLNSQAAAAQPNLDLLFAVALNDIDEGDIAKLKIYDLSGKTIYSSIWSEVGGTSNHPDLLKRALRGETANILETRAVFMSRQGELHNADFALTYMPLTYAGKQIGVIEVYDDSSNTFNRLYSNIMNITLIVLGTFAALYAVLLFAVSRADRAASKWQQAIVASETSLRLAHKIGGIFSWEYDLVHNKQNWSENSVFVLGFPVPSEPTLEEFLEFVHSEDRQRVIDVVRSNKDQGTTYEVEFRVVGLNGSIRWIRSAGQVEHNLDGNPTLIRGIGQDITKIKRLELQLRELTAHLQTVREEEKAIVARDIHDNLGGTLSALKIDIHWLRDKLSASKDAAPLFERVESMSKQLDSAVGVTRRVITDLRPSILDDLGLCATLEWQAGQFSKRTGIKCVVTCLEDEGDQIKLNKVQSINLFRIYQETLANVARHSKASRVDVELHYGDDEVVLAISDNGCGLPEGHTIAPTSFGMLGMRERVEQLDGRIDFYNLTSGGFGVMVILPLLASSQKELAT